MQAKPEHHVDAVHMAIGLALYGLLRIAPRDKETDLEICKLVPSVYFSLHFVSDNVRPTVIEKSTPRGPIACLNFARLIQRYVKQFAKADAATALQYIYLVALNQDLEQPVGKQQQELCLQMLSDVIVETESYSLVLSSTDQAMTITVSDSAWVAADRVLIPQFGIQTSNIQQDLKLIGVPKEQEFLKSLAARLAAKVSADSSPVTWDLIRLYGLAGEGDKAILAINTALSSTLDKQGMKEQADVRDPLCQLAENALVHLQGLTMSGSVVATCRTLLNLKEAKRLYEQEQWGAALTVRIIVVSSSASDSY